MALLLVALFALLVPNGLFVYWLVAEAQGPADLLGNHLGLALLLDAFLVVALLAYRYAKEPIGPVRWPWFVVLSLVGGLGFSVPLYWWLNRRIG